MAEARSPAARDGRRARCRAFCLKYFCEGQLLDKKLSAKLEASDKELPWTIKYRKQIAMAIPLVFVHVIWWTAMVRWNSFHLFTDQVGKQPQYRKLCHSGVRPWYMPMLSRLFAFALLPLVAPRLEVQLGNGAVVEYIATADSDGAASARAFCAEHKITDGNCAWDLVRRDSPYDRDAAGSLALDFPISFASIDEATSVLNRAVTRIEALEPFRQGDGARILQPHWDLAFSGGDGVTVAKVIVDWSNLYSAGLRVRADKLAPSALGEHNAAATKAAGMPGAGMPGAGLKKRIVRVVFVSSWFVNSAVGRLVGGLFVHLDRSKFEIHAAHVPLGNRHRRDFTTDFIDAKADFSHALPADLAEARSTLESINADVIIFTDVGMEAFSYALAFGRFAVVQCVFWGHPTTSGIQDSIDYYLIMDGTEPGDARRKFAEQLVRLDTLGAYYFKNQSTQLSNLEKTRQWYKQSSSALSGIGDDKRIYAVAQHCQKHHPLFDEPLLAILEKDASAVIVVRNCSATNAHSPLVRRLEMRLGGVEARLVQVPQLPLVEFVKLFGGAHVALETFPFGGSITSLDAFEAGTPVIVRRPKTERPALTQSLYGIMGLDDCVAQDDEAYVELAIRIANDENERLRIRRRIEARRHLLFENEAGVRELENFLVKAVFAAS
ncbi:hypothetical protein M885DRAFT_557203 [Pelagophyceae sp. CCMP2097]|nr:hypothetical protein M885DRAFT_557203 [Pelagophyceae sp. CCMP2097]